MGSFIEDAAGDLFNFTDDIFGTSMGPDAQQDLMEEHAAQQQAAYQEQLDAAAAAQAQANAEQQAFIEANTVKDKLVQSRDNRLARKKKLQKQRKTDAATLALQKAGSADQRTADIAAQRTGKGGLQTGESGRAKSTRAGYNKFAKKSQGINLQLRGTKGTGRPT
jgi:hypothetical protein